jgi:hypothetical protein
MSPVGEPAGGVAVVAVVEPERPAKAAQMSETRDAAVKMPAGEMAPESPDERSRADPPTEMPAANSSSDMTAANSSAEVSASNSTAEVPTAHPAAKMSAAYSPTKVAAAHSTAVAAASSAAGDRIGRDRSASQHDCHHDEHDSVQREFHHGRYLSVRDDAAIIADDAASRASISRPDTRLLDLVTSFSRLRRSPRGPHRPFLRHIRVPRGQ